MPPDTPFETLSTYQKAILQTVAYKRIRELVNDSLKAHGINTTQWMILGVLCDNPDGQKISTIAQALQVEVPLITTLSQALLSNELVVQHADARDRRSKPLTLTLKGADLVHDIEADLVDDLRLLETDLSPEALQQYFQTLRILIANGQAMGSKNKH